MENQKRHRVWSDRKARREISRLENELARTKFAMKETENRLIEKIDRLEMATGISKVSHNKYMPQCPGCKCKPVWEPGFQAWVGCKCVFDVSSWKIQVRRNENNIYSSQEWIEYIMAIEEALGGFTYKRS